MSPDPSPHAGGLLDPPAHYSGYVMGQKLHFP